MTKIGTIVSYPQNPRVWKAQIAAAYNGVELNVDTQFEMGKTNKTQAFLEKFPYGKVPVMDTPDGPLYESDAIAFYVANSVKDTPLLGKTNYEKALVTKFVHLASSEVGLRLNSWLFPILGYTPYNKEFEKRAIEDLRRALGAIDAELATKTFLVGERVSLADITLATALYSGFSHLFDLTFRSAYPNLTRWFVTCVNQPNFSKVMGEVKLCETPMKYTAPKKEEKPKAAAAPKKEQKPQEPAMDDDDDQPKDEKPKEKNPLDLLPPSKLIMDAWKRQYSNNEVADSIKWFWENFDAEGYSLWKVQYKYNDELTAIFMSSNLIGGFFQRLERARKYAFGSMIVTGEANNNKITGYFLFRGQGIPAEVSEAADFESYSFVKADASQAQVRAEFNDYLAWEGPNLPGKFADGKIFK